MLKIAWHQCYAHPLPLGHRFPMLKYELLPQQLIHQGIVINENFFEPQPLKEQWITNTHTKAYWEKLKTLSLNKQEERRTGFPLSKALIDREIIIAQGTINCAEFALHYGAAMNIAGGTHHAFTNMGEGFCLLNDVGMAANYLLEKQLVQQILVVDLDVHQGNGTAEIFKNNTRVFTFSMHGAKNFPVRKEQSDLDVSLPDDTNDELYLKLLNKHLNNLVQTIKPDFIFFQSGVDVLLEDKLGRLALSIEGCKQRDEIVIKNAYKNKIPLVVVMGGGYAEDIKVILQAHTNTFKVVQDFMF